MWGQPFEVKNNNLKKEEIARNVCVSGQAFPNTDVCMGAHRCWLHTEYWSLGYEMRFQDKSLVMETYIVPGASVHFDLDSVQTILM